MRNDHDERDPPWGESPGDRKLLLYLITFAVAVLGVVLFLVQHFGAVLRDTE